jgi:pimeloyl-ACP methyl ester carboxylesterase
MPGAWFQSIEENGKREMLIQPIEEGFIDVPGKVRLHYEIYGNPAGVPVIVVNDFFSHKRIWSRCLAGILSSHKLILYDLRGQGSFNSHSALLGMCMEDQVNDLLEVMNTLQVKRPVLIGASGVTLILKEVALSHPELIDAIVFVSPVFTPFGSDRFKMIVEGWISGLDSFGFDHFYQGLFTQTLSNRAVTEGKQVAFIAQKAIFYLVNTPKQIKKYLELCLGYDCRSEDVRKINVPVLIVAGEEDFLNGPSSIKILGKLMMNARVEIIDFCGHLPHFESNSIFTQVVGRFINERAAPQHNSL